MCVCVFVCLCVCVHVHVHTQHAHAARHDIHVCVSVCACAGVCGRLVSHVRPENLVHFCVIVGRERRMKERVKPTRNTAVW